MNKNAIAKLKDIRSFTSLVKYLREEMSWPIESDNFDLLTFDYTPEELGIDSQNAAKIQEIKRLRPLETNQPWGIFFVKFEPKKLPVVALRRILSRVVEKKRASANKSDQVVWRSEDLLFVSNYGDSGERQIAVAHFSEDANKHDLPTLKVLGWDNSDTALHLDQVADALTHQLAWPAQGTSPDAWRTQWRSAFTVEHREVINTSKELAESLANLAGNIRDRIKTTLKIENDKGPLRTLMVGFQKSLIHDLDTDGFADMYAQTIAYGLLSARIAQPTGSSADDLAAHMRTSPFLRELMETFLKVGGRRGKAGGPGIDFDELGVSEVQDLLERANMNAILVDFGDRNQQEDPVMHFFEGFLQAYDAKIKKSRGVFYTPHPVVSYIVRSVHELLQTEFGLVDGLADTTTWGEMCKSHKDLQIPKGTSPDQAFVQILDPATGTGTFIVEVIDIIHKTMIANWVGQGHGEKKIESLWNEYVPKHLLPRLHAYELMMAPYAIAHLKVGLKLKETGYGFGSDERARIYLTNALEPAQDFSGTFEFAIPALAHEAQAVNEVKRNQRFTVVIGNPPYAKLSSNRNKDAEALVNPFKLPVRSERNIQPLSDDYVKFFGFMLSLSKNVPVFSFGMITNRGYLNGLIHRGVRQVFHESFGKLWTIDLHGDSNVGETAPNDRANENVFDIQQGVAITVGVKSSVSPQACKRMDSWGTRAEKYTFLTKSQFNDSQWELCELRAPNFFFQQATSSGALDEYETFLPLAMVMPSTSTGIKTHRDDLVLDFTKRSLIEKIANFVTPERTDREVRSAFFGTVKNDKLEPGDNSEWSMSDARKRLQKEKTPLADFVRRITYRPFDERFIFYSMAVIDRAREEFMSHMDGGQNLGLITTRQVPNCDFSHILVTHGYIEMKTGSHDRGTNLFALYLKPGSGHLDLDKTRRPNLTPSFLCALATCLSLKQESTHSLPAGLTPEDIFHYAYAVFHSPGYRSRYAEFLKIDFPRLPLTGNLELFRALARLGGELTALHLLESPKLDKSITEFTGGWNPEVEKISWSRNSVWVDKAQSTGFQGVREDVWNFHIGGYQVCAKWLKDRKGRKLSKEDITHYQKIVVALSETIRLMKEIDEVIVKHGGWPGAFQTNSVSPTKEPAKDNAVSNKD